MQSMGRSLGSLSLVAIFLFLAGASGDWQQSASAAQTAWSGRAVRAVLASRQGSDFRYFPHAVSTAQCAIPFVFRSVKGTCSTQTSVRHGYSGQIHVVFKEWWPWRAFHYSGAPRRTLHHWWMFDLLSSGKVTFVKDRGDFPPNFAR
jgi:hypothetical protein